MALAYDVQGNLTAKNEKNYSFDYGNRLRAATNLETYLYDGQGRRVASFTPAPASVPIYSVYALNGQLVHTVDQRRGETLTYVYMAGSQIARIKN